MAETTASSVAARDEAIAASQRRVDSGQLFAELRTRVARRTVSTDPDLVQEIEDYYSEDIGPAVEQMGFAWQRYDNPVSPGHPFVIADRTEEDAAFTVLLYGHADVQPPQTDQWREAWTRGPSQSTATAGTAADPRTTRPSTRSISQHSRK